MFPWRDKKEPYKRQREHRCPSSRLLWNLLAVVVIAANLRPSSSSEMSGLEILDTAPSFLIVNGLHVLSWKPFSDTCLQVIRANPVASSLSVPPGLLISIDPPVRVWTARTLRWESYIHPLCRHPPHSCSSFPKYSWEPLTLRSVAGASYILACLLSDPHREKLWEVQEAVAQLWCEKWVKK